METTLHLTCVPELCATGGITSSGPKCAHVYTHAQAHWLPACRHLRILCPPPASPGLVGKLQERRRCLHLPGSACQAVQDGCGLSHSCILSGLPPLSRWPVPAPGSVEHHGVCPSRL